MINIFFTDHDLTLATHYASKLGTLNNSILKGSGNMVGALGEIAFERHYPNAKRVSGYDFDYELSGYRVEIKTQERSVAVQPDYSVVISQFNPTQQTDFYYFISVQKKNNRYILAQLLGYLRPKEFFEKAIRYVAGDYFAGTTNRVLADCFTVQISELRALKPKEGQI